MKKDLIFTPAILLIGVLLFLLRATGMTAHIAISVIGLLVLIAYAVLTKKDWKIPALEILMRAFYGIALITGIVILNVHGIAALSIIHKASAVLFMALIIVLLKVTRIELSRLTTHNFLSELVSSFVIRQYYCTLRLHRNKKF